MNMHENNQEQLVPEALLQGAAKILFVTHLAIGDFAYMQTYFAAFAQKYPHIKIDLWVDEVRRTRLFWRWKYLKNYSLFDWLKTTGLFNKIYDKNYSVGLFKKSIRDAQAENYPIIISFASVRPYDYARYARIMAPQGFVAGIKTPLTRMHWLKARAYRKLNAALTVDPKKEFVDKHITDVYATWFERLCGVRVAPEARRPFIAIPRKWITFAKLRFMKWGIDKKTKEFGKVFFINAFAKDTKRCWPVENVVALIKSIKHEDAWSDLSFVVNATPEEFSALKKIFDQESLNNVYLFTASHSFFQLPAVIYICDLVISVETAVMHLASALGVPVIALMRQKNPEWAPWDAQKRQLVLCERRDQFIKDIPVAAVFSALKANRTIS